jgi:hypothetical protein
MTGYARSPESRRPPARRWAERAHNPNVLLHRRCHRLLSWIRTLLRTATCVLGAACVLTVGTWLLAPPGTPRPTSDDPTLRPADYQSSGDYYNWEKTGKPKRPWFHKYDQSLVMKIFLAERTDEGRGCRVCLTFEQALEVIERLDRLTCGTPNRVERLAVLPVELRAGVGNGLCQAAD